MEIERFEQIQDEFMPRAQKSIYCNVATVDTKGRPRSRIMHLVWEGPIGWVITWAASHKARHLANNPHVSIAYIGEPLKPVYVECIAAWVTYTAENIASGSCTNPFPHRWASIPSLPTHDRPQVLRSAAVYPLAREAGGSA